MNLKYNYFFFNGINLFSLNELKFLFAINFAIKSHFGQKRKSGDDYVIHPLQVGSNLWNKYSDKNLSIAGFLHDCIEDCGEELINDIYFLFGEDIGFLVDSVTKTSNSFYNNKNLIFNDKTLRLLWAGIKDVRVFLLKIEDRSDNIATLSHLKPKKQIRMAFETQAIYSPLKKILKLDKTNSLNQIKNNLFVLLEEKNFKDIEDFKKYLFSQTFSNLNEYLYSIIYKNSSKVIWRVEGMDMYKMLINNLDFKEKIEILSVKGNSNWLHVDFKFKKGGITQSEDLKLSLSSFQL